MNAAPIPRFGYRTPHRKCARTSERGPLASRTVERQMAMVDENLCRAELSPSDRARQTTRRKAIYLELYPETENGINQHSSLRQLSEPSQRFIADTAKVTGQSERVVQRVVQRDAERGQKILPEVLDMIRGTDARVADFAPPALVRLCNSGSSDGLFAGAILSTIYLRLRRAPAAGQ